MQFVGSWIRDPLHAGAVAAVALGVATAGIVSGPGGVVAGLVVGAAGGLGAWAVARELPPPPPPAGWDAHDLLCPPPLGHAHDHPHAHPHDPPPGEHPRPPET